MLSFASKVQAPSNRARLRLNRTWRLLRASPGCTQFSNDWILHSSAAFGQNLIGSARRYVFMKRIVAHHHRRGAAASQALDKLDCIFAIGRGLRTVLVRIQPELVAKMLAKLVSAAQRAAQGPADPQMIFADRL